MHLDSPFRTMALCNSKSPIHFHIQQSPPVIFLNFLWLTIFFPFANSISLNFSSFEPNDPAIIYQGDACATNGVIQLTNISFGRASYAEPIQLWDAKTGNLTDFSTFFSFIITPSNSTTYIGGGLAFFLSPFKDQIDIDSVGGLLGLFNFTENNQIVAVEFDTYQDSWDPCPYHIGIDVNSIHSKNYSKLSDILASGTAANAWVTYSSTTKTLSVNLSYDEFRTSYTLSYVVDWRQVLPEWVSVGFSAGVETWSTERHTITSWTFNSTLGDSSKSLEAFPSTITGHKTNPRLVVFLPVGIGCLISGVGLFLFIMKKKKIDLLWRPKSQVHKGDNGTRDQTSPPTPQGSPQRPSDDWKDQPLETVPLQPKQPQGASDYRVITSDCQDQRLKPVPLEPEQSQGASDGMNTQGEAVPLQTKQLQGASGGASVRGNVVIDQNSTSSAVSFGNTKNMIPTVNVYIS